MEIRKKIGFVLGPLSFIFLYFYPFLSHNPKAHRLFAIFILIVIWWVTECIPIPTTALLVPILITVFQVAPVKEAFAPFANPIIMLFLGSFILARAMSVHSLDRKLAYYILSLKSIGQKRSRTLLALGLTSAFLSLWISNTATTAMMFPICLGILSAFAAESKEGHISSFNVIVLLMIGYAASVGGIGTPIGSPPNLIAIGLLERLANYRITFFQWMVIGFIVLIPMYLALYLFMKFKLGKNEESSENKFRLPQVEKEQQKFSRGQKNVLAAFLVTVCLWITPGLVALFWGKESALFLWLQAHFPESIAAIIGAGLLFFLPVDIKKGQFTISIKEAMEIDWGTLLLFGGGLSLGFQIFNTGLADIIGRFFISPGRSASLSLITLLSITLSVLLTEVTSNTASANMIIPIIIAITKAAAINPLPPVIGSAIGCSFAFMLPVATPPNAIIFGSRLVPLTKMIKYGFWLEITGIVIIWTAIRVIAPWLGLI